MKLLCLLTALLTCPLTALAADWQPDNPVGVNLESKDFCRRLKEIHPVEEPAVSSGSDEILYVANPQNVIPRARKIHVFCDDGALLSLSIIIRYEHSYAQDKDRILRTLNASFDKPLTCPEQPIPTDACAMFLEGHTLAIFTANESETGYALTYTYPEDPAEMIERLGK